MKRLGLTVLALMALTAILVLVALGWWARSTTCMGRLKAIGHGIKMYVADNDGYLPPYATHTMRGRTGWIDGKPDLLQKMLAPYGVKEWMWRCPEWNREYITPANLAVQGRPDGKLKYKVIGPILWLSCPYHVAPDGEVKAPHDGLINGVHTDGQVLSGLPILWGGYAGPGPAPAR